MDSIKKHVLSYRFFTLPVVCLCLSLMTLPQTSCAPATPKPTQNITLTVPEGTQSHGNPKLLCTPTSWTDVAIFFFANYVAHAATIKSLPGEPALATLLVLTLALCLPVSGVSRGVKAIGQRAGFSSTPLESAAKAEALCVVVRTPEWVPQRGDVACVRRFEFFKSFITQPPINTEDIRKIPHLCIEQESMIQFLPSNGIFKGRGRKVHGICCLPRGYALSILPAEAPIMEIGQDKCEQLDIPNISSSFQRLKGTLKTLRHTRDDRLATEDGIELGAPISQADGTSNPDKGPAIELCPNYNVPKGVIALFQTLYASATLYRARGDQIQRYGYAAFGLTVAPYLVMSIINLLGAMITPDYPCVYLVRSEIMDEAFRRQGAKFEGMVATLLPDPVTGAKHVEFCVDEDERIFVRGAGESMSQRGLRDANDVGLMEVLKPDTGHLKMQHPTVWISEGLGVSEGESYIGFWASMIVGSIPIAINGSLSHFRRGHSTIAQRAWTMIWLAFGLFFGCFFSHDPELADKVSDEPGELLGVMMYFAPAIGGFVVVAQMLMSYGSCIEIGEVNI